MSETAPRPRRITEDEFIEQFAPETDAQADFFRQRDWTDPEDQAAIEQAVAERRLWTMVDDGEGGTALVQGYAYVNRLYYVICAVPYGESEVIEIESDTLDAEEDREGEEDEGDDG